MTTILTPCSSSLPVPAAQWVGMRHHLRWEVRPAGKHQGLTQLCLGSHKFRARTLLRRALSVFVCVVPCTECEKAEAVCDHQAEL